MAVLKSNQNKDTWCIPTLAFLVRVGDTTTLLIHKYRLVYKNIIVLKKQECTTYLPIIFILIAFSTAIEIPTSLFNFKQLFFRGISRNLCR